LKEKNLVRPIRDDGNFALQNSLFLWLYAKCWGRALVKQRIIIALNPNIYVFLHLNIMCFIMSTNRKGMLGEVPIEIYAVAQKCRETPMGQQK